MVGTKSDPGLMVLSLNTIFDLIKKDKSSDQFEVTCSYLEVYNEVGMQFEMTISSGAYYLLLLYDFMNICFLLLF